MARQGDQTVNIGVSSYLYRCGSKPAPAIFQALGPQLHWIERVLGEKLPYAD